MGDPINGAQACLQEIPAPVPHINEVWDLSDIYNVTRSVNSSQNNFSFKVQLGKAVNYLAVDFNDLYTPSTEFSGRVVNQNIKGEVFLNTSGNMDDVDYLIITANSYKSQAQKLASFHQNNSGLKTKVVTLNEIYHEFSSGKQDVAAIRNLVKYVYNNANSSESRVKYVCLFGGHLPPPFNETNISLSILHHDFEFDFDCY